MIHYTLCGIEIWDVGEAFDPQEGEEDVPEDAPLWYEYTSCEGERRRVFRRKVKP